MSLSTIGSIAAHINQSLTVPAGISGVLIDIVDMARQHVANYVGTTIGSNSIDASYQPAIVSLAKADTIDFVLAEQNQGNLSIDDLSVGDGQANLSSQAYRDMAERYLKALGRKVNFRKTLV